MRDSTLIFLLRNNKTEICLAMKKRGCGVGKLNGVGGKVEPGEDIREAACREAREEIEVDIFPSRLRKVGVIEFHFENDDIAQNFNQRVHIFFTTDWTGAPVETEEMNPSWYKIKEIPFDKMWPDDIHWLQYTLKGKNVSGVIRLNKQVEIEELKLIFY